MAAIFRWAEHNGAGPTATLDRAEMNWKNVDDSTTAYSSSPITAGSNSYDKFVYGVFGGSWNQILNGLWDHTGGVFGTGLSVFGAKSMTAAGDRVSYRTPVTTSGISNATDMTATNSSFPTGGRVVYFNTTGPNDASAASSVSGGGTAFSNYLYTQLQTTVAAAAGDTATGTFTLQYDEN